MYTYRHMHTCMCTHKHTHRHARIYTDIDINTHVYTQTHPHTLVYLFPPQTSDKHITLFCVMKKLIHQSNEKGTHIWIIEENRNPCFMLGTESRASYVPDKLSTLNCLEAYFWFLKFLLSKKILSKLSPVDMFIELLLKALPGRLESAFARRLCWDVTSEKFS